MRSCRAGTIFLYGQKYGKEPLGTLQIGFPDPPKQPKGQISQWTPLLLGSLAAAAVGIGVAWARREEIVGREFNFSESIAWLVG